MANYSLNISDAVSTGWDYAKKYGLIIAVIILCLIILTRSDADTADTSEG